jgi:hypothetical protein
MGQLLSTTEMKVHVFQRKISEGNVTSAHIPGPMLESGKLATG